MLPFLLFLYANLAQVIDALAIPAVDELTEAQSKCIDITHCRTIWSIIWSCLATIFACAWVAVHRNVPDPKSGAARINLERVGITVCALLVPEYIVAWAIRQWIIASDIAKTNEKLAKQARKDRLAQMTAEMAQRRLSSARPDSGYGEFAITTDAATVAIDEVETATRASALKKAEEEAAEEAKNDEKKASAKDAAHKDGGWNLLRWAFRTRFIEKDDRRWTKTHGFFVLMGGFYYFKGEDPEHPVTREEIEELVKSGSFELPNQAEINDKSKGDAFSKAVAMLQTIWFVMQCIARPIQHLPLTKFEIVTLAYTAINLAMYRFWWAKPLSVSRPFRVQRIDSKTAAKTEPGSIPRRPSPQATVDSLVVRGGWAKTVARFVKAVVGTQDDEADLSKVSQVPTFYAGKPEEHQVLFADAIALAFAMVFGAVHCIAWSFAFPSHTEKLLWRMSSVALVGVPAIYIVFVTLIAVGQDALAVPVVLLSILGIPFYLLARVVLLVLAFTTLRSLPATALETVHWTTFVPHI